MYDTGIIKLTLAYYYVYTSAKIIQNGDVGMMGCT